MMARFYSSVPVNRGSVTMSQHTVYQGPHNCQIIKLNTVLFFPNLTHNIYFVGIFSQDFTLNASFCSDKTNARSSTPAFIRKARVIDLTSLRTPNLKYFNILFSFFLHQDYPFQIKTSLLNLSCLQVPSPSFYQPSFQKSHITFTQTLLHSLHTLNNLPYTTPHMSLDLPANLCIYSCFIQYPCVFIKGSGQWAPSWPNRLPSLQVANSSHLNENLQNTSFTNYIWQNECKYSRPVHAYID